MKKLNILYLLVVVIIACLISSCGGMEINAENVSNGKCKQCLFNQTIIKEGKPTTQNIIFSIPVKNNEQIEVAYSDFSKNTYTNNPFSSMNIPELIDVYVVLSSGERIRPVAGQINAINDCANEKRGKLTFTCFELLSRPLLWPINVDLSGVLVIKAQLLATSELPGRYSSAYFRNISNHPYVVALEYQDGTNMRLSSAKPFFNESINGRRTIRWSLSESSLKNKFVAFTQARSWKDIGVAMERHQGKQEAEHNASITTVGKQLQLDVGDMAEKQKIENILQWFTTFEYNRTFDLLDGWNVPRDINKTIQSKRGDCNDFVQLFRALLKSNGIASVPILTSTDPRAVLIDDMPLAVSVNHILLYVPSQDLYLDPTKIDSKNMLQDVRGHFRYLINPISDEIIIPK